MYVDERGGFSSCENNVKTMLISIKEQNKEKCENVEVRIIDSNDLS